VSGDTVAGLRGDKGNLLMRGQSQRARSAIGAHDHRRSRAEVDIQSLICRPAFLVAVDAYAADRSTFGQMVERAFGDAAVLPRGLSLPSFTRLVIEIVRRIHSGALRVPAEWKAAYSGFYIEQPDSRRRSSAP
jgi:hypothetical protein